MAPRDRPHIVVLRPARAEPYTRPPRRISARQVGAPTDRRAHGVRLAEELRVAETEGLMRREGRAIQVEGATDGIFVVFASFPEIELALESLDPRQGGRHPELVAVREVETEDGWQEQATVFVLDEPLATSSEDSRNTLTQLMRTGHATSSSWIESRRSAWPLLSSSGQIHRLTFPSTQSGRGGRSGCAVAMIESVSALHSSQMPLARLGRIGLRFADRTVVLVQATPADLLAHWTSSMISELRRPPQPSALLSRACGRSSGLGCPTGGQDAGSTRGRARRVHR